jgi:hypothetical protein
MTAGQARRVSRAIGSSDARGSNAVSVGGSTDVTDTQAVSPATVSAAPSACSSSIGGIGTGCIPGSKTLMV